MRPVCVVIAAHNAEATIARAIASALGEPEVGEVIVVDDRSDDATCASALAADDGTGRLQLIKSPQNRGPAAARNRALSASKAPLVSILDSDDFFVAGRFRALLADDDWDMIADNIVFVAPEAADAVGTLERFEERPQFLGLARFVEGNISRRGRRRGEIGFLKPVMRRSFLETHGLRYGENLRLGEDYDLYARALARGARYKVVRHCGYVAVERPGLAERTAPHGRPSASLPGRSGNHGDARPGLRREKRAGAARGPVARQARAPAFPRSQARGRRGGGGGLRAVPSRPTAGRRRRNLR